MKETTSSLLYSLATWATSVFIAPLFIILFDDDSVVGGWDMLFVYYLVGGLFSIFSWLGFFITTYIVFEKIDSKINKRIALAISAFCISVITFYIFSGFAKDFIFTDICFWYTTIVCIASFVYKI